MYELTFTRFNIRLGHLASPYISYNITNLQVWVIYIVNLERKTQFMLRIIVHARQIKFEKVYNAFEKFM